MSRPMVAIVGRPNVGKSTLFNRLVGRRVAIVADLPGTTRDRISTELSWGERLFNLVDTGGLEPEPESDLWQQVKEQVEVAIEEAQVIIFLVDVKDGVTPVDQEIAQTLRRSGKPVVLVANKADSERRQGDVLEFYRLGLGDPLPVSAYHGMGMEELLDCVVQHLPPSPPPQGEEETISLAIVGRPNVGKSMLLNAILGQERVIVSESPGTTRDAIDTPFTYKGQPLLLIDTAGIRRRGKIGGGVERYSNLRALEAIDRADVALLVIDATEPVTAQDVHIAGYIRDACKGMVLVINKWDLASEVGIDEAQCAQRVQQKLKFMPYIPLLYVSAKFGRGIEGVLATAGEVFRERNRRIPTSVLNQVVSQAMASHPPRTVGGKSLSIFYATQADVNPPTFVFFVNDAKLMHFSYERFLENRLRQAFGFFGTPLRLNFKNRVRVKR